MSYLLYRIGFTLWVCLLWSGVAQAQLVSEGDLVVTDLFQFTAPNLSIFDSAGASQSTHDLLFCSPFDVEVNAAGTIFVSGGQTDMLYRLAPGANPDCIVVGHSGVAIAGGMALSTSGMLFVVDSSTLVAIDPGAFDPGDIAANRETVGSGGDLAGANDVAIGADGMLWVATNLGPVVRLDADAYEPGNPTSNQTQVGLGGSADATDIAIGPTGDLFVAEAAAAGSRIVRYDPDSFEPSNPSANQLSIYTGFSLPSSVVFDSTGQLLVLDSGGVFVVNQTTGAKTLLASGSFGVPFARLAVAPPARPPALPALSAIPSAVLAALLCLTTFWWFRSGRSTRNIL